MGDMHLAPDRASARGCIGGWGVRDGLSITRCSNQIARASKNSRQA
jgi:hypothetical protein